MDRRTILFLALMGATFFGFNIYFSKQRAARDHLTQQERAARQEAMASRERSDIERRTEPLTKLPLVKLMDGEDVVAEGINVGGNTLVLAWQDSLPDTLYVDGKPQVLQTKHPVKRGPALYASEGFQDFDIAAVPESGTYDVQLVTFPPGETPKVYLALYTDGTLSIPLGPVEHNGIGLFKTPDGYLPLGYFEAVGDVFVEMQNLPVIGRFTHLPETAEEAPEGARYYVLENETLQLVFSDVGGALTEINLPFESKENQVSVVKEIGFDRDLAEDDPQNARFPSVPYKVAGSDEEQPPGEVGGYYPLLRRSILGKKPIAIAPQYYSTNLVSDYPEMAELKYSVTNFTDSSITFEATQAYRRVRKTYTLASEGAPYCFDLEIQLEGDARGLWLTSGIPEVEIMSNTSNPRIQYRITRKGKPEVQKLDLPKPKELITVSSTSPDWVVNSNGYLGVISDPLTEIGQGYRATAIAGQVVPTRLSLIDPKYTPYPAAKYPGYQTLLPMPAKGGTLSFRFYTGPFEENTLKAVDKFYTDPATGENPGYRATRTFYGWFSFISKPFAKFLFVVMDFFHTLTGSWGISIILLTVFLRVLLYPLNAWSIKSMRRMQKYGPQMQEIQKKYKKDPARLKAELGQFYAKHKINPLMGCLPILIQIPFLIAMFDLLKSSFQLRGAVFIPGWIDNLTAPDVLFSWSRPIFFFGTQFHLLPILLGVVMFIQQRLSSKAPKDPSKMTDQQRQQRSMGSVMSVVFVIMFYNFPSGLNLYWLSSMTLGIGQQWLTNKILDKKEKKA